MRMTRASLRLAVTAAVAVAVAAAGPAHGHGMRTASLEILDSGGAATLVTWKTTIPDSTVRPVFAPSCVVASPPAGASAAGDDQASFASAPLPATHERTFALHCAGGLLGGWLAVEGLGPVLTEAIIRVVRPDGSVLSHVLTASAPRWELPGTNARLDVARQYLRLGVQHILGGADHLLFLLALVLYVRHLRSVLWTETAFTLSHSLSFSATALGWIHVSAAAAEACIALSLVLVALEIGATTQAQRRAHAPVQRRAGAQGPAIALVFGLVHGLGFAGALGEIGIPDREVAAALVAFGVGVEVGQLAFLLVVFPAVAVSSRLGQFPRLAVAGSYAVGVTGCYWFFQRLAVLEPERAIIAALSAVPLVPAALAATIGGLR